VDLYLGNSQQIVYHDHDPVISCRSQLPAATEHKTDSIFPMSWLEATPTSTEEAVPVDYFFGVALELYFVACVTAAIFDLSDL